MFAVELAPKTIPAGEGKYLNVLGDSITIKLSGDDTEGAFILFENVNAPGRSIPRHVHQHEDETFYVLEGEVEFQIGEEKITARAGATVFLPRDVPHGFRVVSLTSARMLVLATPAGLDGYFTEMNRLGSTVPPDMDRIASISARYGISFPSTV